MKCHDSNPPPRICLSISQSVVSFYGQPNLICAFSAMLLSLSSAGITRRAPRLMCLLRLTAAANGLHTASQPDHHRHDATGGEAGAEQVLNTCTHYTFGALYLWCCMLACLKQASPLLQLRFTHPAAVSMLRIHNGLHLCAHSVKSLVDALGLGGLLGGLLQFSTPQLGEMTISPSASR